MSIKESDWKKFRKLREVTLDRLCLKILDEVRELCDQAGPTNHEKYGDIYQHIRRRDKDIVRAFDGPSRSVAWLQLLAMIDLDLVTDEELSVFSEDLQATIAEFLIFRQ